MARKPRQFEIGGIYHVINRGVEGRDIFLKPQDYSRLTIALEFFNNHDSVNLWPLIARAGSDPARSIRHRLMAERQKKKDRLVEFLSFAFMPNHYHFLLREIVQGGISFFLKKLGGYASYFNKQYNRLGPLFQSRFKAVPIQDDRQLLTAFVYIHTNPIELKEPQWKEFWVKDFHRALRWLEKYRWSSYHDYVGRPTFPEVLQTEFLREFLGSAQHCRKIIEDWVQFKAENFKLCQNLLE